MWRPIAEKWLHGANAILHADAARAYEHLPIEEVSKTKCVHQVEKIGGKWVKPAYAKAVQVRLQDRTVVVMSGTQYVDGIWQKIREEVGGKPKHNEP
eukprot:2399725-Amphidinium_carterae.1